mmetsp:Transcript_22410/g.46453  ORF Transcript_22410/g.46453 Transcript_22410/m.46453 type:complete len:232 (+) Transcript_22410:288-983(+)
MEDALPSKYHALEPPGHSNVVCQLACEGNEATSVNSNLWSLRGELLFDHNATALQQDRTLSRDLLKDEALTAEEGRTQSLPEARFDMQSIRPCEIHSTSTNDLSTVLAKGHRYDVSRDHSPKPQCLLLFCLVCEPRHHEGFTREHSGCCFFHVGQHPGFRAITHHGMKMHPLWQTDHPSWFCTHTASRLQHNLDQGEILGTQQGERHFIGTRRYKWHFGDIIVTNLFVSHL